uniref:Uncharacterized protein n=1 Tax=Candidatus Kentrum sp. FM TaxID=2126340 RepID=A0A450TXN1_9GAMM|nr:MAG: hypothetical protein BECKFM1743C_GA0114222_107742 [Candidatus Kentron sp. FM]VFJ74541.1 MAG: hypothetical protein BECKFM1743A_GA0114220_107843 [Candidatus Kentron sp. FM]VFK21293.1 MAG: hypothetical protein BECKFM1743B_GA0114221_107753 [Candidatus Kentron sp. FM]
MSTQPSQSRTYVPYDGFYISPIMQHGCNNNSFLSFSIDSIVLLCRCHKKWVRLFSGEEGKLTQRGRMCHFEVPKDNCADVPHVGGNPYIVRNHHLRRQNA